MTTFEKCEIIRKLIINRAAEVIAYTNWSDNFATNQLRELPEKLLSQRPDLNQIQPSELTANECRNLGFGRWSDENPMYLIPLWLFPFLADNIKTTCIDGSQCIHKNEMDNDNRFGCLAYGIIPKDM